MKKKGNVFTDKDSIRIIDRKRFVYLIVAILFFLITELGRNVYRPYIYSNGIDDFGLADSIGNLGGIVVQVFFTFTILNSPGSKGINVILFIVAGYILYEILQPILPKGVFDWKDIYGTLIGGIISLGIWLGVHAIVKNRVFTKI